MKPACARHRDGPEQRQTKLFKVPSSGQDTAVDSTTRLITAFGVLAGLCGLVVVVTGGFITARAVSEGVTQIPAESPIPLKSPQVPSNPLGRSDLSDLQGPF